ncbi:hypothetical protein PU629_11450 [Pullulanibacillus sp. KACC 23026]|uniref:hypothetical protein n=1 Tax=Pullulanibacillus sp. KACC 23026 TaxID=3028315 RepID=UPI0023AFC22A|nr:hypothetical protein [Pullulanibacillus sp. KACC 23026]WEG10800.1 hypothetical protein PU629_11450 [Pullulanibacillus sp. KACC 23026]
MKKKKVSRSEALLWSIALPGFGQLLNGKLIKGILFILIEFVVNMKSHFNLGIMYSFQGHFLDAQTILNFQWLLFYPCCYMYAMWDAFKDAEEADPSRLTYLPFLCGAVTVTTAIFYSTNDYVTGKLFGPIFFPMLALIPGLLIGWIIKKVLEPSSK